MKFNTVRLFFITILVLLSGCSQQPLVLKTTQKQADGALVCPPEARRQPKFLNLDELHIAKNYYAATNNQEMVIKYLEEMIKKTTDPQQLQQFYLEMADAYFQTGKFDEASRLYTLYLARYPGSKFRVYAHYQAILCRFYTSLTSDRDQTKTQEALVLTQDYIKRAQTNTAFYKDYLDEVKNIQQQCCDKLYESDLNIFEFYLKKGSFKACQIHLDEMRKRFATLDEHIEPKVLTLECMLAEQQNNQELLAQKKTELETQHPTYVKKLMAAGQQQKKKSVGLRF